MIAQADSKFSFSLLTQKYISQFSSKTIKKLSTFTLFFIPAFLLNHSVCVAYTLVSTGSFTGGTYERHSNFDGDGKLQSESYVNFRNNTGITANDFHLTYNYPDVNGSGGVTWKSQEYLYPRNSSPSPADPPPFSVPSGGYFSPYELRYVYPVFYQGSFVAKSFLTDIYWTLDGKPLGDPPVPPIIVDPLISGFNSFCTEEYLPNVACNVGTLGDVPIAVAVPEPLNILGAGVALGFGVTFKRKLAKNFKK